MRRLMTMIVVLVIAVAGPLLARGSAQAADSTSQLLVLMDSSGSMAASDGAGSTKIDAAKRAVDKIVSTAPSDAQLGLRVYGATRDKNDPAACHDSRLLVPVSTVDKGRLTSAAAGMTPRGQTPIAYSLQQAVKDFHGDTPRTILLVSDGIETCNADPCAVARSVEGQGIALRIDVVGFRVDSAARNQLECVARAGHGTYYDASDGPSLQSHVERSSTRALREYRPSGTPIDGSSQPVGAPKIKPGQYLDTLPPNSSDQSPGRPIKYYTFDWKPGETVYFSVTVIPPASAVAGSASKNNGINLQVLSNTGGSCDNGYGFEENVIGGGIRPSTGAVTFPSGNESGDCTQTGPYQLGISNGQLNDLDDTATLEIVMLAEPKITNSSALPAPAEDSSTAAELPQPASTGTRVGGGADYDDAPTLTDGAYADSIRPGETLFYRVKLDWGQRLDYRVDLAPLDPTAARKAGLIGPEVHVKPESPLRVDAGPGLAGRNDGVYSGRAEAFYGSSYQVRWRNRESSSAQVKAAALAGYYYVDLHLSTRSNDPNYAAPFTLSVKASGERSGVPRYATSSLGNPVTQQDDPSSSAGGGSPTHSAGPATVVETASKNGRTSSPVTWVALGAGIALVVCGGTVITVLMRRH